RVVPEFQWPDFDPAVDSAFSAITNFKRKTASDQKVADFWHQIAKAEWQLAPAANVQRLQLIGSKEKLANLLDNSSFENSPDGKAERPEAAKGWLTYHNRMVNAETFQDRKVARTGKSSLTARGLTDYSGVLKNVAVPSGRLRLSFWYKTTPKTRHGVVSVAGGRIKHHLPPEDDWTRFEMEFTRYNPRGGVVRLHIILALRHRGSPESQIWFDDVSLELISPEGIED
ncbi:MAG: hypothetical protein QF886_18705, partial [Planctomycetota bacterium]|nr:hypothetical protein [Planctomycetota bacterium]